MEWNRINLRAREKNLPPVEEPVLWATNENAPFKKIFFKFVGYITKDGKYINTGHWRYKITNNFWWSKIEDPDSE